MAKKVTKIRSHIPATKVRAYAIDNKTTMTTLEKMGIRISNDSYKQLKNITKANGYDMAPLLQTGASIPGAVQFLQHWIPQTIKVVTESLEIDNIIGRTMAGRWEDEEIVQPIIEHTGQARPYGDTTNTPNASYNTTYERRTIVRFEEGVEIHKLEEARATASNINALETKRFAASNSLAIEMNNIGFYGYNDGKGRTYGFLNDINLPAYESLPIGASGDSYWDGKTYEEITKDLRMAFSKLRIQTGGNFKPDKDASVLTLPLGKIDALNTEKEHGDYTVRQWLKENYPNCRIESASQLDGANGGVDAFYLHAETIKGMKVVDQYIQDVLRLIGVEQRAKGFNEVWGNATAGTLFGLPIGVVRFTGL